MSTTYSVVLQSASSHGNERMVQLRRAPSESDAGGKKFPDAKARSLSMLQPSCQQVEKVMAPSALFAPSPSSIVTEYYDPEQVLREIYLASREGERFAIPITLAVQLCALTRNLVESTITETATNGRFDPSDKRRLTVDVPCSTDALRTIVDFANAKLELEEEGLRMTEHEKKGHWQDFMFYRVSGVMDLDGFADEIGLVADLMDMSCLYDLMECCFRLRL